MTLTSDLFFSAFRLGRQLQTVRLSGVTLKVGLGKRGSEEVGLPKPATTFTH